MADKEPYSADDIKRRKRNVNNNEPNEMNFHTNTPEALDDLLKKLLGAIPEVKAADQLHQILNLLTYDR
ncbi:MAG: hypothetical protein KGD73_10890 [Candidatus Lokiarchaeota archaeon]|nr:hypothetical protein [Candidatus Lokiarchaeota archaeon]